MAGKRVSDKLGKRRSMKQIREDTFSELRERGTLDVPVFKSRRIVNTRKPQGTKEQPYCCEDKFGDNLPQRFVHCFDCPKTYSREQRT